MFSGKTEELIRRLTRAQIAGQRTHIFKPATDKRYAAEDVVSHDARKIASTPVTSAQQLLLLAREYQTIGIDEAQFFDPGVVDIANELANQGIRVIAAGLDMDYRGRPFGPMPQLLAVAEFVTKLHAICTRTGQMAQFSHRKAPADTQTYLGAAEAYEPLSRQAYLQVLREEQSQGTEAERDESPGESPDAW
jgi:thymidine kinase